MNEYCYEWNDDMCRFNLYKLVNGEKTLINEYFQDREDLLIYVEERGTCRLYTNSK